MKDKKYEHTHIQEWDLLFIYSDSALGRCGELAQHWNLEPPPAHTQARTPPPPVQHTASELAAVARAV
jgi:hypothetical protein